MIKHGRTRKHKNENTLERKSVVFQFQTLQTTTTTTTTPSKHPTHTDTHIDDMTKHKKTTN